MLLLHAIIVIALLSPTWGRCKMKRNAVGIMCYLLVSNFTGEENVLFKFIYH